MTAMEIIHAVQTQLRLPKSAGMTDSHAALLLSFANKVQRDFMTEKTVWDALKVYSMFDTDAGTALCTISATGGRELDVIRSLQIGSSPLSKITDSDFRAMKRGSQSAQGQPRWYRNYSRQSAGSVVVELLPEPDSAYPVSVEMTIKPPYLVQGSDVPLLDSDTIIAGVLMLAREEQGDDFQAAMALFQVKLGLHSETHGESNWGDVVAV